MPDDRCRPPSSVPFQVTSCVPGSVCSPCFKVRIRRPSTEKIFIVTGPEFLTGYEIAVSGLNGFGDAMAKIGYKRCFTRMVRLRSACSGTVPPPLENVPVIRTFTLDPSGTLLKRFARHLFENRISRSDTPLPFRSPVTNDLGSGAHSVTKPGGPS